MSKLLKGACFQAAQPNIQNRKLCTAEEIIQAIRTTCSAGTWISCFCAGDTDPDNTTCFARLASFPTPTLQEYVQSNPSEQCFRTVPSVHRKRHPLRTQARSASQSGPFRKRFDKNSGPDPKCSRRLEWRKPPDNQKIPAL